MKTAIQITQREDSSISGLIMNRVYPVKIDSLKLNEHLYLFDRARMNIEATGEGAYAHLWLLCNPSSSSRVFAYSLDARNLTIIEGEIVEKQPFEVINFGRTHYMHEFTADRKLLKKARLAFGGTA